MGVRRKLELAETHWKTMLRRGSMTRLMGTRESAWDIVVGLILQKTVVTQSEVGKAVRYSLQEVLEEHRELGQLLQNEDDALISPVPWEASHCVTRYRRFWKRRENWLDSCGTRMMLLVSKSSRRSRKRPWSRRWLLVGEWLSSSHMIEPEYRFD